MLYKRILLVLLIFTSIHSIRAQESFEKGTVFVNAGLGLGQVGYYGFFSGINIPLNASVELGISDYVSLGPQIGYAGYNYNYGSTYNYKYTFLRIGGKLSFHYLPLIQELGIFDFDTEKMDFFIALNACLETSSYRTDSPYVGTVTEYSNRLPIGPSAGFRYMPKERLGIYVESGVGLNALINLGITLKIK